MSEAELHVLRARLIGGQLAKASRGELEMRLPVGLVNDAAGRVVLDPDAQVQKAVATFFETFARTGSATATVRAFRQAGLLFPRRLVTGAHKGELAWGHCTTAVPYVRCRTPAIRGHLSMGARKAASCPGARSCAESCPGNSGTP